MACQQYVGPNTDLYKELFKKADVNGDGVISIVELRDLLKEGKNRLSDSQIANTFVFFDGPLGDKKITFDEFCAGLDKVNQFVQKVKALFHELDTNQDGFLDREELKGLLRRTGRPFTDKDLDAIVREADTNGDNKISFREFVDTCVQGS